MAIITRRRIIVFTALFPVSGVIVLFSFLYSFQDNLIYNPSREVAHTPNIVGLTFDEITLKTSDGLNISAWHIPAHKRRGTVLFFHGNAGNISDRLASINLFIALNMDVLIIDYRGYGGSEGSPGEDGTYRDAEAAWDYLVKEMHVPPEEIIIFGRSLGSAIAAEMALRHKAGGFIIESGFTSVADIGKELFPYLPVEIIVRHKYDTINKINRISIPKLIVHSPQDEVIPYSHGIALFHKAAGPKSFLRISGGHNDGFMKSGQSYTEGLDKFISEILESAEPNE